MAEGNAIYNKNKTELIKLANSYETDFEIPQGVTLIGNYAFKGCVGLQRVKIPNSITEIRYRGVHI